MCGCVCVCVERFCAQRSLHVAIQSVKSSLRTLACDQAQSRQPAVCARLHRFIQNTCFQCSNKMPFIKVSRSSLEELIELVRQRPEIYDVTHPDHKGAVKTAKTFVLGVWLDSDWGKSIQHLYTQYKIHSAHLTHTFHKGMETGTPHTHTHTHTHIRRRTVTVHCDFSNLH